jgi:hypothetical protein
MSYHCKHCLAGTFLVCQSFQDREFRFQGSFRRGSFET